MTTFYDEWKKIFKYRTYSVSTTIQMEHFLQIPLAKENQM
jgi:hypothetical protein